MQYSKCQKCIHRNRPCQIIMAQAINLLGDIEYLIQYAQTRKIESKCLLKVDYSCENFTPRTEEE